MLSRSIRIGPSPAAVEYLYICTWPPIEIDDRLYQEKSKATYRDVQKDAIYLQAYIPMYHYSPINPRCTCTYRCPARWGGGILVGSGATTGFQVDAFDDITREGTLECFGQIESLRVKGVRSGPRSCIMQPRSVVRLSKQECRTAVENEYDRPSLEDFACLRSKCEFNSEFQAFRRGMKFETGMKKYYEISNFLEHS